MDDALSLRNLLKSGHQKMLVKANASHGSWVAVNAKHQYSATETIGKIILAGYHNGNG